MIERILNKYLEYLKKKSKEKLDHKACTECWFEATNGHAPTCSKRVCGHMILTPSPLHNGGMWCAEKLPCKFHTRDKEGKSQMDRMLEIRGKIDEKSY